MPTFQYQAALPSGVSIYGVCDVADQNELLSYLQTRGMTLVNSKEMSLNGALTSVHADVPRMFQLRIGDRLREALLTDMPAHEALRAIAEEPFEHPVLMTLPWIAFLSFAGSLTLAALSVVIPESRASLLGFAAGIPLCTVLFWLSCRFLLIQRPQQMLRRLADRIERGDQDVFSRPGLVPEELRVVMEAPVSSHSKATSVAEMVPALTGMQVQSHRFATQILGPVVALSVVILGIYVMLLTVVRQFHEIFLGFGVELPALTKLIMQLSVSASFLGVAGLVGLITCVLGMMVAGYLLLVSPRTAEIWEAVPGLGLSVRWLMQARVARILAVLIRNKVPPADAIVIASKASGFSSVAESGKRIAEVLNSGTPELAWTRQLSGLPLSMLFRISRGRDSESDRQETAQAFQSFASALEQASSGNGAFLALLFEVLIIVFAGGLVGLMVIGLFMPLIRLLNDLSLVMWSLPW